MSRTARVQNQRSSAFHPPTAQTNEIIQPSVRCVWDYGGRKSTVYVRRMFGKNVNVRFDCRRMLTRIHNAVVEIQR